MSMTCVYVMVLLFDQWRHNDKQSWKRVSVRVSVQSRKYLYDVDKSG